MSSAAFAAPGDINQSHNELMTRAASALDARDFKKAEELYTRAIDSDFGDPGGWSGRGVARKALGKDDDAFDDYSTFVVAKQFKGFGDSQDMFYNLDLSVGYQRIAEYRLKKNDLLRAYAESFVSVRIDKTAGEGTFALAWLTRADIQYALGDLEQAEICLQNAQKIEPTLTRAYTQEGARKNALKHKPFQETADLSAQIAIGRKAEQEGKTGEAFAVYNAMIEAQPLSDAGWLLRGSLYSRTSLPSWAIDDLTTAIDVGTMTGFRNTPAALINRAVVLYGEGKFRKAFIDLEFANKLKPNDPDIMAKLAETRLKVNSK